MGRLRHIVLLASLYILISHIPMLLSYLGLKLALHTPLPKSAEQDIIGKRILSQHRRPRSDKEEAVIQKAILDEAKDDMFHVDYTNDERLKYEPKQKVQESVNAELLNKLLLDYRKKPTVVEIDHNETHLDLGLSYKSIKKTVTHKVDKNDIDPEEPDDRTQFTRSIISRYIQPRSVLGLSYSHLFNIHNMEFIPTMKTPCFFVEALSNETSVSIAGYRLSLKCLPYFFIYGTEKCGTSDMYHRLEIHQDVIIPVVKEPQFFNNMTQVGKVNHHGGRLGGYINMFRKALPQLTYFCNQSLSAEAIVKAAADPTLEPSCKTILLDATPRYFHNSFGTSSDPNNLPEKEPKVLVHHKVRHLLPNAKLIILLRNPTDRMFSAYKYFSKLLNHTVSADDFHQYVQSGYNSWKRCLKSTSVRNCQYSFKLKWSFYEHKDYDFRSFNQIRIGIYVTFLKDLYAVFPKENVKIIQFSDYSKDPLKYVYDNILPFIGLDPYDEGKRFRLGRTVDRIFNQDRANHFDMLKETREILDKFYKPFNVELAQFMNDSSFLYA